jgi:polyphosphate kinase 2 (PPK2 family)
MTKQLYLRLLNELQVELIKLPNSIVNNGKRLAVVFEG